MENDFDRLQKIQPRKVASLTAGFGAELAFNPTNTTWASAGPGVVFFWNQRVLAQTHPIPGYAGGPLRFSPDGSELLAGPWIVHPADGTQERLLQNSKELTASIPPEYYAPSQQFSIVQSAWMQDGQLLAAQTHYQPARTLGAEEIYQGPKGQLILLSRQGGRQERVLVNDTRMLSPWIIATHGQWVAAGTVQLSLWEVSQASQPLELAGKREMLTSLQFSPTGALLLGTRVDGTVELWNTADGSLAASWQAHPSQAQCAAFHPHLPLFATGGHDGQVSLWSLDLPAPRLLAALPIDDRIQGCGFDPTGRLYVASRFAREEIGIYELLV